MIKALSGKTVILGLSDENMKRLKNGNPIKFNLKELGLTDTDVLIFNGTSEQSMYEDMKEMINPLKTKIFDSRYKQN